MEERKLADDKIYLMMQQINKLEEFAYGTKEASSKNEAKTDVMLKRQGALLQELELRMDKAFEKIMDQKEVLDQKAWTGEVTTLR